MRRKKPFKRGRAIPVLAAGVAGYLIGGWHPVALRSIGEPTAAASIAQRFPQEWNMASASSAGVLPAATVAAVAGASGAQRDAQRALFSPDPMVPQASPPAAVIAATPEAASAPAVVQTAEAVAPPPVRQQAEPRQIRPPAPAARPAVIAKPVVVRRAPDRPGYLLDDAQIASIKTRLNLSPDQERMWPAVEAALRNIAYTHTQQARSQGYAAAASQTAAVDPESVEGLKSAATPLILSFSDEQKEEVRNLAHVMGLDQLASQF